MTEICRGLEGVIVTETRLSRVEGEQGRLLIGGFPVEELAPRAHFEEALFLLWHDRLPDAGELERLRRDLASQRELPSATVEALRAANRRGLPVMDALQIGISTLGIADPSLVKTDLQGRPRETRLREAIAVVAAVPTLIAAAHRLGRGLAPVPNDPDLCHAAAYLWLQSGCAPSTDAVRALETYLVTTVDHGMNASTFTARVIASTRSDLVSAISGALGALKGPLHGGAPGPALDMVRRVQQRAGDEAISVEQAAERTVREALARGERIMGFGHRVYRVRDPRADVLGEALKRLGAVAGDDALQRDARIVESVVLRVLAEEKPHRRLDTNVEFYTALLLQSLGLPEALFTPTFAVARVGGWTAHVLEQVDEDRLIRPRVAYAGPNHRDWVPLTARVA